MTKTPAQAKADEHKAEPKAAKPAKADERFIQASESRFSTSAEFTFPLTSYIPVAGTPLHHLLRPEYWAGVKQLKAGCRIWVVPEDEAWFAELLVRKAGQGYAKVQILRTGELDSVAVGAEPADGFEIQFRGPLIKHRIVRVLDGHVLKDKLESYEDATLWLREHRKMLAA